MLRLQLSGDVHLRLLETGDADELQALIDANRGRLARRMPWALEAELNRVEIRAAPENARSQAVAERLGFTREGTLRETDRVGERYLDSVVLSLLAREWEAGAGGPDPA